MSRGGKSGMKPENAPDRAARKSEPTPVAEVILYELYQDLKLRPDQELLFESYAEKIRALAIDLVRERRALFFNAKISLLERVDRSVDIMRNRFAAVEDIALAAKALHAGLTTEQREIADPRLANLLLLPFDTFSAEGAQRLFLRKPVS